MQFISQFGVPGEQGGDKRRKERKGQKPARKPIAGTSGWGWQREGLPRGLADVRFVLSILRGEFGVRVKVTVG